MDLDDEQAPGFATQQQCVPQLKNDDSRVITTELCRLDYNSWK
jgi:hypothetical protein